MAARTHCFRRWVNSLLYGVPPQPKPDYSRVGMLDFDVRIASLDLWRANLLDAADDVQREIEDLLDEKAVRLAFERDTSLPRTTLDMRLPLSCA